MDSVIFGICCAVGAAIGLALFMYALGVRWKDDDEL
jgi:hypothetical protein